ncbi:peptide ABC transporter permease [Pseudochelatococcus sp. B33]
MVTHTRTPPLDPAADAAALLRRLGFAILTVLLPLASFLSRRSTVVLAPVGVSLLIVSSVIEAPPRGLGRAAGAWFSRPAGIAGLLLLAWTALSIFWAPDRGEAFDKLFNIVQALLLALLGVSLLPQRVRASNLYLISIGVAASALLALALLATRPREVLLGETATFERGLTGLTVAFWPAVAWLESRSRRGLAATLAVVTAAAFIAARLWVPLGGFAAGVVIYALALRRPVAGNRVVAWGTAGILLVAPLIAVLLSPLAGLLLAEEHALRGGLAAWQTLILGEPGGFILGHGLDTLLPARLDGSIPAHTPQGLPFELWFELGAVGAIFAALTLYFVVRSFAGLASGPAGSGLLVPGLLATVASAFALSCFGVGVAFPWWVTTLAVTIIAFWAIAHGQFRTSRPKARWPVAVTLPVGGRRARGENGAPGEAGPASAPPASEAQAHPDAANGEPAPTGRSFVRRKVPTRDDGAPIRKE